MSVLLTIAVDVEGGDCDRALFIEAVLRAVIDIDQPVRVIFCGDEPQIQKNLDKLGDLRKSVQIKIEHSSDKVESSERSSSVWKNKPKSSGNKRLQRRIKSLKRLLRKFKKHKGVRTLTKRIKILRRKNRQLKTAPLVNFL